MPDDTHKLENQDRTRINVNQPHQLLYWTKMFKIDEETLKAAVKEAGPAVGAVRQFLRNRVGVREL